MLYKDRKAINQEIKSAHWASLLFIVAQGRTSIYLWTFYSPKQKRKYILWPFKMSKKMHTNQVIQQKRSLSWAEPWEKFLLWLLLQRPGWCSRQNPSHHPLADPRTLHVHSRCSEHSALSRGRCRNPGTVCPQPGLHTSCLLTLFCYNLLMSFLLE